MTAASVTPRPAIIRQREVPVSVPFSSEISGFHRLGFFILVIYLFLIYSRIFDVKLSSLHIPGISFRVMLVMVVLSQCFTTALKSNIGKAMLGLTVWFVLAVPTSEWKGGSAQLFVHTWVPSFVIFLATAGLIANFAQFRRAVSSLTWAFFVLMVIAVLWEHRRNRAPRSCLMESFPTPMRWAEALFSSDYRSGGSVLLQKMKCRRRSRYLRAV